MAGFRDRGDLRLKFNIEIDHATYQAVADSIGSKGYPHWAKCALHDAKRLGEIDLPPVTIYRKTGLYLSHAELYRLRGGDPSRYWSEARLAWLAGILGLRIDLVVKEGPIPAKLAPSVAKDRQRPIFRSAS